MQCEFFVIHIQSLEYLKTRRSIENLYLFKVFFLQGDSGGALAIEDGCGKWAQVGFYLFLNQTEYIRAQ